MIIDLKSRKLSDDSEVWSVALTDVTGVNGSTVEIDARDMKSAIAMKNDIVETCHRNEVFAS